MDIRIAMQLVILETKLFHSFIENCFTVSFINSKFTPRNELEVSFLINTNTLWFDIFAVATTKR